MPSALGSSNAAPTTPREPSKAGAASSNGHGLGNAGFDSPPSKRSAPYSNGSPESPPFCLGVAPSSEYGSGLHSPSPAPVGSPDNRSKTSPVQYDGARSRSPSPKTPPQTTHPDSFSSPQPTKRPPYGASPSGAPGLRHGVSSPCFPKGPPYSFSQLLPEALISGFVPQSTLSGAGGGGRLPGAPTTPKRNPSIIRAASPVSPASSTGATAGSSPKTPPVSPGRVSTTEAADSSVPSPQPTNPYNDLPVQGSSYQDLRSLWLAGSVPSSGEPVPSGANPDSPRPRELWRAPVGSPDNRSKTPPKQHSEAGSETPRKPTASPQKSPLLLYSSVEDFRRSIERWRGAIAILKETLSEEEEKRTLTADKEAIEALSRIEKLKETLSEAEKQLALEEKHLSQKSDQEVIGALVSGSEELQRVIVELKKTLSETEKKRALGRDSEAYKHSVLEMSVEAGLIREKGKEIVSFLEAPTGDREKAVDIDIATLERLGKELSHFDRVAIRAVVEVGDRGNALFEREQVVAKIAEKYLTLEDRYSLYDPERQPSRLRPERPSQ